MTEEQKPQEPTVDKDRLRQVLARTVPDETMNISSAADLVRTVAESEIHSQEQHKKVTKILLETLEDEAMGNKGLDFNVADLQETTKRDGEGNILHEDGSLSERLNDNTVPGRYDIKGLLGTGATGQVFDVHDNNFDRDIAVKFMHPDDAHNQRKLLRFIDEASITAKLAHPNILPVHDLDYTDGALIYYSMGRANGHSLEELLHEQHENTLGHELRDLNDRVRIMVQVCNAIAYAHSRGIVHNDIKPGNIMVGQHGEVLVVDWGTATTPEQRQEPIKRMLGTPIYMSPEQARRECSDERSDIYCLGATLFHLLTLRFPCWNDQIDVFWDNKRNGVLNDISEDERKRIPKSLIAITEKSMAADPEQRYPSVEAMILDLDAYLQGEAVSAHQDTLVDLIKRIYHKQPRVIYAAIIGLILVCLAGAWLYYEKALEYSRWITKATYTFDQDSDDLFQDWQLDLLPAWDANNLKPISDPGSYLDLSNKQLLFTQTIQLGCASFWFKEHIPGNMRISWEYQAKHDNENLNCFIGGKNRSEAYTFHVGGYGDPNSVTLTKGSHVLSKQDLPADIQSMRNYDFRMIKTDTTVQLFIDNNLIINFNDPDMLVGNKHQYFGFDLMFSDTHIDNIHIEYQPLPQKISPITVAHHYYSSALYKEALEHYVKIRETYPDTDMAVIALYRIGRSYAEMGQTSEAAIRYKQFLRQYPNHKLSKNVALHYAAIQARLREWGLLESIIDQYHLAQLPRHLRDTLMATINNHLVVYLRNSTDGSYLNLLGRTQAEIRADAIQAHAVATKVASKLQLENGTSQGGLQSLIKTLVITYLNDIDLMLQLYPNDIGAQITYHTRNKDIDKAIALQPGSEASILLRNNYHERFFQLPEEQQIRHIKNISNSGTLNEHILEHFSKLLPDNENLKVQLLLNQQQYEEVVKHHKNYARLYLYALDWLGRQQDMLKYFEEVGGIHNLNWLRIRTFAKLRRYREALRLYDHGSDHYALIKVYEAIFLMCRGKSDCFDEFTQNELLRISQIRRLSIIAPLAKWINGNKENVMQAYRDTMAWNTAHGFDEINDEIKYVLGEIDEHTLAPHVDKEEFFGNSNYGLLKAIRLELAGSYQAAKTHYRAASKSIDYDRVLVGPWRMRNMQKAP